MKNVLLISYFFPPVNLVASLRSGKMAKYLPRYSWQPWILTIIPSPAVQQNLPVEISDEYIIRTKYLRPGIRKKPAATMSTKTRQDSSSGGLVEKLYILLEMSFQLNFSRMPDRALGWYPYAVKAGISLINRVEFDAIYSMHGPPTCHLIARRLQKEFRIPWVADYRDFWSLNHYIKRGKLWQRVEEGLERWAVSRASSLVVVNKPMEKRLNHLTGKPVTTITNGFDESDFDLLIDDAPNTDQPFSLLYSGSLYSGYQNPFPLFQAVQKLCRESFIKKGDFVVRFLGTDPSHLLELAKDLDIIPYLEFLPVVPLEESIKLQCQSTALLLLKWNDERDDGVCPVKFYEYLGTDRPVLVIGNYQDVTDEILGLCRAGVSVKSVEEIVQILRSWITLYRENGELPWENDPENTKKFTRKVAAGELASLLEVTIKK